MNHPASSERQWNHLEMKILGTLTEAHEKIWSDTQRLIGGIQSISSPAVTSIEEGIGLLQRLRQESYEDLNQIQHEHTILLAAEWLIHRGFADLATKWLWNPRQTGDASEPDLRGVSGKQISISAEITTSAAPNGVIDTRMARTLAKLSLMPGGRFYFVKTAVMANRARTKIRKAGWAISVVDFSAEPARRPVGDPPRSV
jgi:hypothetical protein